MIIRQKYAMKWATYTDGYGSPSGSGWEPKTDPDGDFVSSRAVDEFLPHANPFGHAPLFDIDQEVQLVPSRTPGHFHLYCPTITTWRNYKKAVKALAKAGIVDPEWAKLTVRRKFGLLRRQDI